jgi:hypothetical protein
MVRSGDLSSHEKIQLTGTVTYNRCRSPGTRGTYLERKTRSYKQERLNKWHPRGIELTNSLSIYRGLFIFPKLPLFAYSLSTPPGAK